MPVCKLATDPDLTAEQDAALARLLAFPNQVQTLGGYAGTGKTTLIKHLVHQLPHFAVCAYTGKAANVLRRKGVNASTIHSLIYHPVEVMRFDKSGRISKDVEFVRRDELSCAGVIVDEASMVSEEIYDDLLSYDLPLIFVGDHGQLPPVNGGDFNLMANPQITLEQIHRNAGPISRFANFLRQGNRPQNWQYQLQQSPQIEVLTAQEADRRGNYAKYDQIIVGFNAMRVYANKLVREELGSPPDTVAPSDRVICLRNCRAMGLFNGMQGVVSSVSPNPPMMTFRTDAGEHTVRYIPEQFNTDKTLPRDKSKPGIPFDYAYAVTCHKAQGDEWDHALVVEERMPHWMWDAARWRYTAASRAKRKLTWVVI